LAKRFFEIFGGGDIAVSGEIAQEGWGMEVFEGFKGDGGDLSGGKVWALEVEELGLDGVGDGVDGIGFVGHIVEGFVQAGEELGAAEALGGAVGGHYFEKCEVRSFVCGE
jgi:hypothetical protein